MWSKLVDAIDSRLSKYAERRRRERLREDLVRVSDGYGFREAHMHDSGALVVLTVASVTVLLGAESHKGRVYGRVHLPYRVPDGAPGPSFETEDGYLTAGGPVGESDLECLAFQARGPDLFATHGTTGACRRLLDTVPAILPSLARCEPIDVTTRIERLVYDHNKYVSLKAMFSR